MLAIPFIAAAKQTSNVIVILERLIKEINVKQPCYSESVPQLNAFLMPLFPLLFLPLQTPPPEPDQSAAWRKCLSQFTDVDDYRRHGSNTWHDESGIYANSEIRTEVLKPTNPIPERLA